MLKVILLLLLTGTAFAQLDYSPRATNKDGAAKMHFALNLFRGDFNRAQEDFLLRAIRDRRSISEPESDHLFSTSEVRDIFFGIGREDVSVFRQMYDKDKISEKKAIWGNLTKEQQIDARRVNFAWGVGYLDLNDAQIEYLLRLSKELPDITRIKAAAYELESVGLFSEDVSKLLFGSIGTYTSQRCRETLLLVKYQAPKFLPDNCPCSVGSKFNMSCSGTCETANGRCTVMVEGCGFAWLFRCDGFCQLD